MPAVVPALDELIDRVACEDGRFDPTIGRALQDAINAIETAESARVADDTVIGDHVYVRPWEQR